MFLANSPIQAESLLHSLEQTAGGIGLHVNTDKTEYIYFNQRDDIFTLKGGPQKLVNKFTYPRSSVSSTDNDINMLRAKAWTAINWLLVIWKYNLTDKIKCSFFQAAFVSILLYRCTTWMLTKRMEKKLDGNYTRILQDLRAAKQQLYSHLPPIMKTIQKRQTRHAGH